MLDWRLILNNTSIFLEKKWEKKKRKTINCEFIIEEMHACNNSNGDDGEMEPTTPPDVILLTGQYTLNFH